eukprot:TRINITY_DN10632_c0_g1_i9.p1 TRINITY_DN10632_c0_g1~~TRINITY_DN10632_c0_g1_i9.p1  ORF type:complete len:719 (+),score=189.70 TRINITY_DN10632_c0_g1_i9:57-2213(+)
MGNCCPAAELSDPQVTSIQLQELQAQLERVNAELDRSKSESAKLQSQVNELEQELSEAKKKLEVAELLNPQKPAPKQPARHKTPQVGDAVISHWVNWTFYKASIASFDPNKLTYMIDFEDGDQTHREQSVEYVALDQIPDEDDVGIGSPVLFPQGTYYQYEHWHLGVVTDVRVVNGTKVYDGKHVKRQEKQDFRGYPLSRLRVSPNILGAVADTMGEQHNVIESDVFFCYSNANTAAGQAAHDKDSLPSYDQAASLSTDPIQIRQELDKADLSVWEPQEHPDHTPGTLAQAIQGCKVVVACVSNEFAADSQLRGLFQFAKKIANKPVIPVVVGAGSWDWQATVVGFLIAGELYINMQDTSLFPAKMDELNLACKSALEGQVPLTNTQQIDTESTDLFVSYCWNNSLLAHRNDNVKTYVGTEHNDPRLIKLLLEDHGYRCWLDIEQLESGGAGLFEELAEGLKHTKAVVLCLSDEYAMSENCRTEIQFAMKSLKKPVVPIIVGKGDTWKKSVVGMLLASLGRDDIIDLRDAAQADLDEALPTLLKQIKTVLLDAGEAPPTVSDTSSSLLRVGDKVISHWVKWQFYPAEVEAIDRPSRTYTIAWEDGDTTGRTQEFGLVAKDITPAPEDVGVGSTIFFPQGNYVGNADYNRSDGTHWHLGMIDAVREDDSGQTVYDGHHIKGANDDKWVTFTGYEPTFIGYTLSQLRVTPNMMEMVTSAS